MTTTKKLPFEKDKFYHFMLCGVVSAVLTALTGNILIGFVVALGLGFLKEIFDAFTGGHFNMKDIVADMIGAAAGAGLGYGLLYI